LKDIDTSIDSCHCSLSTLAHLLVVPVLATAMSTLRLARVAALQLGGILCVRPHSHDFRMISWLKSKKKCFQLKFED
jgi:hypothetical protein